jgi:hypothetical protein
LLFFIEKNKEEKEIEEGERRVRSPGHNLNITNEFTDGYH